MKRKALIFYISRFSGHYHAAAAIENGFYQLDEDIEVTKLNAFSYTNPFLEKIINKAYMGVIQKRPQIWGNIYDDPDVLSRLSSARERLHEFNMPKMEKLLEREKPDVVLCTQAFPCGMVAAYKARRKDSLPLIGVLTDYAPHSYWIFNEVDHYVVPSEECITRFVAKGVPESKIHALGIPVHSKFSVSRSKSEAREELGLERSRKTVLIMGGTQGLGRIERTVESIISDSDNEYQIMVVTGSNKKLFKRLEKLQKKTDSNSLKVYGFVDFIELLMDAADLLITKAGGLTTAEAIVKGKAIVIVNPIPGHEKMNASYLVSEGASEEIGDLDQLYSGIRHILETPDMIANMEKAAKRISHPDSSREIAQLSVRASCRL